MPIRPSSIACECPEEAYRPSESIVGTDYIDGYPSIYGNVTSSLNDVGVTSSTITSELREGLGIPSAVSDGGIINARYLMSSGIKVSNNDANRIYYKAYRLDCGCELAECGQSTFDITGTDLTGTDITGTSSYGSDTSEPYTDSSSTESLGTDTSSATATATGSDETEIELIPCIIENFRDKNGVLDFNCDKLLLESTVNLIENFGIHSGITLDGTIPNLMYFNDELIGSNPSYNGFGNNGSMIGFTDYYGIIYSVSWNGTSNQLDITTMTKDPRIPGIPTGKRIERFKKGFRQYTTGITTVTRQLLDINIVETGDQIGGKDSYDLARYVTLM